MTNIFVDSSRSDDTGDGSAWAVAKKFMTSALALATTADTIWVKNGYSNTVAAGLTWTLPAAPGLRIFVTSDAGATPTSSLASGALEATSGGNDLFVNGFGYIRGFTLQAGSTSSGAILGIGNAGAAHGLMLEDCVLYLGSTNSGSTIVLGPNSNNANVFVGIRNSSFRISATAQSIRHRGGALKMRGVSWHASSSIPSIFLTNVAALYGDVLVEASDLSGKAFSYLVGISTGALLTSFRGCKLPSAFNFDNIINGAIAGPGSNEVSLSNCSVGSETYRFSECTYEGRVIDEHTIVRSGGASPDGSVGQSMKMIGAVVTALQSRPLRTPEQFVEVGSTGSKTIRVEFAHAGSALKNNDVAVYALVMNDAGFPLSQVYSSAPSDPAATPSTLPTSTETWPVAVPTAQYIDLAVTVNQPGFIVWWVGLHKMNYTIYVDQKLSVTGEPTPLRERLIPGHGFLAITTGTSGGAGGGSVFGGSVVH